MNLILTSETIHDPAVIASIYKAGQLSSLTIAHLSFFDLAPHKLALKALLEKSPRSRIEISHLSVFSAKYFTELLPSSFSGQLCIGEMTNQPLEFILNRYSKILSEQVNGMCISLLFLNPILLTDGSILESCCNSFTLKLAEINQVKDTASFSQPAAELKRALNLIGAKKQNDAFSLRFHQPILGKAGKAGKVAAAKYRPY